MSCSREETFVALMTALIGRRIVEVRVNLGEEGVDSAKLQICFDEGEPLEFGDDPEVHGHFLSELDGRNLHAVTEESPEDAELSRLFRGADGFGGDRLIR